NKTAPVLKQVIQQLNSHVGLVWAPNSQTLYAAGGCDDAVYAYTNNGTRFVQSAKISLGHAPTGCVSTAANQTGLGLGVQPNASGLPPSQEGKRWAPVKNNTDPTSVFTRVGPTVLYKYALRPFSPSAAPAGTKGGTFPYSVALNGSTAYVGVDRDREVV